MGTRQKVKKSRTPRKFSQSSLRGLTKKHIDIFEPLPNELDEEAALMARLQRKALDDEKARKKALHHEFITGRKYYIADSGSAETRDDDFKIFVYVKKEGIHHMFTHYMGGWSRTYTDTQLIGKVIEEVS